jgi:hypothetical protein
VSDLVLAAVLGPADRNSGNPRYADVVAHLYVGGAGVWQFHRLGAQEAPSPKVVRLTSHRRVASELAAGFALVTGAEGSAELVADRGDGDLDLDEATVRALANLVAGLDVGATVTQVDPDDDELEELKSLPWSVAVATVTADARKTQWMNRESR